MKLTIDDVLFLEHKGAYNVENLKRRNVVGVSTDSRTLKRGNVFFAIRGEKFDGHEFVGKAFENGAVVAVVDESAVDNSDFFPSKPLLVVKDTTKALGQLALRHRKKFTIPFVAVAGSNGKTTTKDMLAAVLGRKFTVLKTEGNLNNHIGVPQTLFRLGRQHDIAVVEIGTNHIGEISYLCDIVQPTHGLITNIGHEHLEFFGGLKGVAEEEGALFTSLGKNGTGFVNADDPWVVRKGKKLRRKTTYGFTGRNVHVHGKFLGINERACAAFSVKMRGGKEFPIQLSVPGKHVASNALAAAAVGAMFKIPAKAVQRALKNFPSSRKRMEIHTTSGVTIIDDTYNANPGSMRAALETVKAMRCSGKKILVLADMLELGHSSEEEHRRIGTAVKNAGDYLLTYGSLAQRIYEEADVKMKFHYEQKNVLSEYLSELVSPGDIVLVKGSRGMKMEDVVTFLLERLRSRHRVVAFRVG